VKCAARPESCHATVTQKGETFTRKGIHNHPGELIHLEMYIKHRLHRFNLIPENIIPNTHLPAFQHLTLLIQNSADVTNHKEEDMTSIHSKDSEKDSLPRNGCTSGQYPLPNTFQY
jgi:hypothetical protein